MNHHKIQKLSICIRYLKRKGILLLCLVISIGCAGQVSDQEIRKVTDAMEEAWRSGRKADVAAYYADDSYIIHTGGIGAQGRKEVNAYWAEFSVEPVDWELTTFLVTKNPEEIFNLPRYKEGEREMKLWTDLDVPLPKDPVFQYGQSDLTYISDGKTMTSTVEFILVWKRTAEEWRIFLDTYR